MSSATHGRVQSPSARTQLLGRLSNRLSEVVSATCKEVAAAGSARETSGTVRWLAETFVRSATNKEPIPALALARLTELGTRHAQAGYPVKRLEDALLVGTWTALGVLVSEARSCEPFDERVVAEVAAVTSDLAMFTALARESLQAARRTPPGVGSTSLRKRPTNSLLPAGGEQMSHRQSPATAPYALLVVVPVNGSESGAGPSVLDEFASEANGLAECATFASPVHHMAAVASAMEPWRYREVVAAAAVAAHRRNLLLVYSAPAHALGELDRHYGIVVANMAFACEAYRASPGGVPLAVVAFDAMVKTIAADEQVAFLKAMFGEALGLPANEASALVDTARAVVLSDGSATAPARELALHRKGVAYRRKKLVALGGLDPAVSPNRVCFFLALRMLDLGRESLPPLGDAAWRLR